MIEHGKVYVCAGCRVPAPLMFRIDGDRTMCPDCVKNRIAELEAENERLQGLVVEWILEHGCQCVICARAKEQHQAELIATPEGSNASGGADDVEAQRREDIESHDGQRMADINTATGRESGE